MKEVQVELLTDFEAYRIVCEHPVLTDSINLRIMLYLLFLRKIELEHLRQVLELSEQELETRLKVLEGRGYVHILREQKETFIEITDVGHSEVMRYLSALSKISRRATCRWMLE